MSITNELREYAGRFDNSHDAWSGIARDLSSIADRIDIAHKHAIGYVDDRDPETMAENGWIRLPVDSECEYIHVGDWITGKWDAKAKVVAITSEDVYWWEPDGCHWCHAFEVRHYHAPTVEDVLREFTERVCDGLHTPKALDTQVIIAEYAAKLRLAGGEDA